jgi:hypothetical protein
LIEPAALKEPLTPLTCTTDSVLVGAAVPAAVNFREIGVPGVADAGVKVAVTPGGRPVAVSTTIPVKPVEEASWTVRFNEVPGASAAEGGFVVRVNGGFTPTLSGAAKLRVPLVPLTDASTSAAVKAVVAAAESLSDAVAPGTADAGVNTPVTPAGRPVTARATGLVKPAKPVTATGIVTKKPGDKELDAGTVREKGFFTLT